MALLRSRTSFPIRPSDKASEWSTLCDSVFQTCSDEEDLFGLGKDPMADMSSVMSEDIFDYSGFSGQEPIASGTSTASSAEVHVATPDIETKQPKAKASQGFWTRTLCLLDRTATHSNRGRKPLRSAKSQPDFSSSDAVRSSPFFPPPQVDQPLMVQRQRPRASANGKTSSQSMMNKARSPSRGRSTGVVKSSTSASVNPYATLRKSQASPTKMATSPRYRKEIPDFWADHLESSSQKRALRALLGSPPLPEPFPHLPPLSDRAPQPSFASFGASPRNSQANTASGPLSPLITSVHPAQIHSPDFAPFTSLSKSSRLSLPNGTSPVTSGAQHHSQQHPSSIATDMTPEILSPRSLPLKDPGFASFDFGFPTSPDLKPWSSIQHSNTTGHLKDCTDDIIADVDTLDARGSDIFIAVAAPNIGLGISYDPGLSTGQARLPETAALMTLPVDPLRATQPQVRASRYPYIQPNTSPPAASLPRTPRTPRTRRASSFSPPPPTPITEPRSRRASSRRTSRHRRTKSLNSNNTPRHHHHHSHQSRRSTDGDGGSSDPQQGDGGFVNYTPQDSGKLLNGVAPSGSSKTKARREKEAADKRRQLSRAAVKAVVDAGGDLEALREAGLFVV